MNKYYFYYDDPKPITLFGAWRKLAGDFDLVVGYTFLGDLLLMSSENEQCAILYNMPPELVDLEYFGKISFENEFLAHETVETDFLKVEKVKEIESRLGSLSIGEVYIPEPYLFTGGDGSVESYAKGDLLVFMDIIGQLQL